jgi:hypothetical protein
VGFFEADPRAGYAMLTRIAELVGIRLLTVQALWARALQRTLETENLAGPPCGPEEGVEDARWDETCGVDRAGRRAADRGPHRRR